MIAFSSPLPMTRPWAWMSEILLSETAAAAKASGYGMGDAVQAVDPTRAAAEMNAIMEWERQGMVVVVCVFGN